MGKQKIYRAGLIPYTVESGEIRMLFMIPSDPKFGGGENEGKKPQIAKGKIDEGETSKEAAIREAMEEVGLFKPNIDGEVPFVGQFLGRTDIYVARIKKTDMFGDTTEETKKTVWLTLAEFKERGRQIHKPVVSSAVRFIRRRENV